MINNSLLLDNIFFSYKTSKNIVLNDINVSFNGGNVTALLGINGSGKTTLLKILSGIIKNYLGKITFNNNIIGNCNFIDYKSLIGYMPEFLQLYPDMKVIDVLRYLSVLKSGRVSNNIIDTLILVGLKEHYGKKVKELSKGMKQKLNLAQAIINNPSIILFDEPSNGFDCDSILMFYRILRQLANNGSIVILSTHHISEVYNHVDDVIILSHGKISKKFNINELYNKYENNLYICFYFDSLNLDFLNYVNINYPLLKFNNNMLFGEFNMNNLVDMFFNIKKYAIIVNNIRTENREFDKYLMNLL